MSKLNNDEGRQGGRSKDNGFQFLFYSNDRKFQETLILYFGSMGFHRTKSKSHKVFAILNGVELVDA